MKASNPFPKPAFINRYTCTILVFAVWISCIDSKYSWVKQYKLTKQLVEMEKEKEEVLHRLAEAKEEYEELTRNKEKYAREKYFLSKPGEDVFIIE